MNARAPAGSRRQRVADQAEGGRHRQVGEPGPQGAVAQAGLQVQGEREQQPAVGQLGDGQGGQSGRQARCAQHVQVQQRVPAARRDPPLDQDEPGPEQHPGRDRGE